MNFCFDLFSEYDEINPSEDSFEFPYNEVWIGKLSFSFVLIAYLSFADLDAGLIFISLSLGIIGLLFFNFKQLFFIILGAYREEFFLSE